jgi:dGTPase
MSGNLFSTERRKPAEDAAPQVKQSNLTRTEYERDYDRILFSTPVRRLADKTQVFPLDPHDSVRTRLTHSHEVANLARSFGTALVTQHKLLVDGLVDPMRSVPSVLAAAGLGHDLGNPPFGHQGEAAIREWFALNPNNLENLDGRYRDDFEKFDGNPQTLRLVTRLQVLSDNYGMNLTDATIGALTKYPVTSTELDPEHSWKKKVGVFQSEQAIVDEVWKRLGLAKACRHPCAYIVEACDDIAYSVLDVEDAVKKGLTSFGELMFYLEDACVGDDLSRDVLERSRANHKTNRARRLSPAELNDVSMQMFRVHALNALMDAAVATFVENAPTMLDGTNPKGVPDLFAGTRLCKSLKAFALSHAYQHRAVVEKELRGRELLHTLMNTLWEAVRQVTDAAKGPKGAKHRYVWNRISENYRRVLEAALKEKTHPEAYSRLQLMTDMVSGMTDTYVERLVDDLRRARALAE